MTEIQINYRSSKWNTKLSFSFLFTATGILESWKIVHICLYETAFPDYHQKMNGSARVSSQMATTFYFCEIEFLIQLWKLELSFVPMNWIYFMSVFRIFTIRCCWYFWIAIWLAQEPSIIIFTNTNLMPFNDNLMAISICFEVTLKNMT